MSRIPFLPQAPVRVRSDVPSSASTDRRASDAKDTFATSLATARADRASSHRASTRREDDDATRAPGSVQQRASVQALMLSGAMKYAAIRKDAPETATLPNPVASQPAMTEVPNDPARSAIVTADATTITTVIEAPGDGLTLAPVSVAPATPPREPALAMPVAAGLQSMPARIAIPENTTELAPSETSDVGDVGVDLSSTNAATASALQLIAQLPIPVPSATLPPVQETPSDTASVVASANDAATSAILGGAVASQPAQFDIPLIEDHVDAPASAMTGNTTDVATDGATDRTTDRTTNGTTDRTTNDAIPATGAMMTASPPSDASTIATNTSPIVAPDRTTTTLTAPPSASAGRTDVAAMQADMAALEPAFRDRLEKVIDRMRDEFGHAVQVVETVRSQARQDALFAQGRTTPGAIVTWTKNSKHGNGLAADLVVDGSWQNPAGYAQLAAVARQEGLRTLGSRDPGHVELPTDGAVSGDTLGNLLNDLQGDAGNAARQMRADVSSSSGISDARASMLAQVANVAQVARVASVAQVAKVASVARPGAVSSQPSAANDTVSPLAVSGASQLAASSDAAAIMRVATPTTAVNMADRISHLMDLQASQDAKPLNSVLLRMDNANGIEDQIRIDTRGTNVDARLGLGNAQQAAALTDRLGELRDALERRGLSAEGVRVQVGALRSADTVTLSKPAAQAIELAAMRAAAGSQANGNTRDQSSRDQQLQREALARDTARHTPRSSSDDPRQRSRREQPEDRR